MPAIRFFKIRNMNVCRLHCGIHANSVLSILAKALIRNPRGSSTIEGSTGTHLNQVLFVVVLSPL